METDYSIKGVFEAVTVNTPAFGVSKNKNERGK